MGKVLNHLRKDLVLRKGDLCLLQLTIQYFIFLVRFLIYYNFSAVIYSLCNCIEIPQAHFSNHTEFLLDSYSI